MFRQFRLAAEEELDRRGLLWEQRPRGYGGMSVRWSNEECRGRESQADGEAQQLMPSYVLLVSSLDILGNRQEAGLDRSQGVPSRDDDKPDEHRTDTSCEMRAPEARARERAHDSCEGQRQQPERNLPAVAYWKVTGDTTNPETYRHTREQETPHDSGR